MSLKNHKYPRKDNKISMTIQDALKASMRMSPEIIYIGKMRGNSQEVKNNLHKNKRFKF